MFHSQPLMKRDISVHRSNGLNNAVTDDTFSLGANSFTITNLSNSQTNVVVNTTIQKNFIKSKKKYIPEVKN